MNTHKIASLIALSVLATAPAALAGAEDIPVTRVFVPQVGFDDNDRIEAVVDGALPNSCYRIGDTTVRRTGETSFHVAQSAHRNREGLCADDSSLPPHLSLPVPFTLRAGLGRLAKGDYSISYGTAGGGSASVSFGVERAPVFNIDSVPYASVDGVFSAAIYYGTERTPVVVTGTLPSDCVKLAERFQIYRTGDVFVILPRMEVLSDTDCVDRPRAFKRTIDLGRLPVGRYLVHVRSAGGDSMFRAFSIEPYRPTGPDDGDELTR